MSRIMSIAPNTTGSTTLSFIPQVLIIKTNGTALGQVNVSSQGHGQLIKVDATGFIRAAQSDRMSPIATDGYPVSLADGYIKNNMDIAITAGAGANAIEVFGFSFQKGTAVLELVQQKILAGTLGVFDKFLKLMHDYDEDDSMIISTRLQGNSPITPEEILAYNSTLYNSPDSADPLAFITVDNSEQLYNNYQITPDTDRMITIQRIKTRV